MSNTRTRSRRRPGGRRHAPNSNFGANPKPQPEPKPVPLAEIPAAFSENAFGRLIPELQQALADTKYTDPTPVQAQCIPLLVEGNDLLGTAQTGTGKTAAFTLPLLQFIATNPRERARFTPRVLILAPTRELAAQIGESIRTYSRHLDITSTVVFGGVGQRPQERAMNRGVDFLVATPGRLCDLMEQGYINLKEVEAFVLDEADRMLDMGFIHDIRKVIAKLPKRRHSLFFSATMTPTMESLANTMLSRPKRVTIAPEQPTVERIAQKIMFVDKEDKDTLLVSVLREANFDKVIIFTQMKHVANKVAEHLSRSGIPAEAIHGNKSQGARTRALDGFRQGKVRALVATDIAARGIDVDGITHVINYHLPVEPETYVHRIGRTARAGAEGDAVSFCAAFERDQLRAIERSIRKPIPVDADHPHHSEHASNATGAEARPEPKGHRGGRPSRNQRGRDSNRGPSSGGGNRSSRPRPPRRSANRGPR